MMNDNLKNARQTFNTPMAVEILTRKTDDIGQLIEEWTPKYVLFGNIKNIYGAEYELAKQNGNHKQIKILVRYHPQLQNCEDKLRIRLNNKVYDIDNIDNINYENQIMEIRAIERIK